MQNKKQTAVEWLYGMLQNEEVIMYHGLFELWYKQAKAMEEEQIIKAIKDAHQTDFFCKYYYPEQYYETTYGK